MKLRIGPIPLREANAFVAENHRHSKPVVGHKFSLGAWSGETLCGVAIVGRPVSRALDNGVTLEVTRVATDGTPNACSQLYAAACREARDRGYEKMVTYTLASETGASVRASGFVHEAKVRGKPWNHATRTRTVQKELLDKNRWGKKLIG